MRPILIAMEGIDGAGKSTLARLLYQALDSLGIDTMFTAEPACKTLKRLLWSQSGRADNELMFFTNDRAVHFSAIIKPAMMNYGRTVITDRYMLSSIAYQYETPEQIIADNVALGVGMPDVTIVLDVDPQTAIDRIKAKRGSLSSFETLETLTKARAKFIEHVELLGRGIIIEDAPMEEMALRALAFIASVAFMD